MPSASRDMAFLNIPYDRKYNNLYLAFISGLCAFGLTPRATLEIPSGERRLDRIYRLMASCGYSFHDLSRVELDHVPPRTPRFNMPFELGLVVAWHKAKKPNHSWFVLESVRHRLHKSLSDIDGTDPLIHDGTPMGLFRVLGDALTKPKFEPSVQHMHLIYNGVLTASRRILRSTGSKSLFGPRVFRKLVVLATLYAELTIPRR
jgi:hypothetical protein